MPNNDNMFLSMNQVTIFWIDEAAKRFTGDDVTSLKIRVGNSALPDSEAHRSEFTDANLVSAIKSAGYDADVPGIGALYSTDPEAPKRLAAELYKQGWHVQHQGGIRDDAFGENYGGEVPQSVREFEAMSKEAYDAEVRMDADEPEIRPTTKSTEPPSPKLAPPPALRKPEQRSPSNPRSM